MRGHVGARTIEPIQTRWELERKRFDHMKMFQISENPQNNELFGDSSLEPEPAMEKNRL